MAIAEKQKVEEKRRLLAGRLLLKGMGKSEEARRCGVSPTSVMRRDMVLREGGLDALRVADPAWSRPTVETGLSRNGIPTRTERPVVRGARERKPPRECCTAGRCAQDGHRLKIRIRGSRPGSPASLPRAM